MSNPAKAPLEVSMKIPNWHPGKLIILWSWGGLVAALGMTHFLSGSVSASPGLHLASFFIALVILLALSAVTWHWLSGREKP
jgi:hypothetical protein